MLEESQGRWQPSIYAYFTFVPQDSCVRQALHCHRLTKLITLQIHFLNTGQNTMLINLGRHRLMDCLMALPRFYQVSKEGKPSQHPLLLSLSRGPQVE